MTGAPAAAAEAATARLEAARRRIDELDAELVRVAAERLAAAAEAGRAKAAMGQGLVDFAREAEVLGKVRAAAARHSLDPTLAEDLVARLIVASTSRQEAQRIAERGGGRGRQAVVVGGAGRMGRWVVQFLRQAGYAAQVLDPAAPELAAEAQRLLGAADLVLVAAPPSEAARLYVDWATDPPRGVVADLCSIKAPLVGPARALAAAGVKVASFHPMFGPSATVLRGADVVLCRTGDAQAEQAIRDLFAPTSARLVEVDLEEHDRLMAEVLTLAHATAIAFAASLEGRASTHSTTFRRLRDVAASVVDESPRVYFEIQAGNPHSEVALARLAASVQRLREVVAADDADGFRRLLNEGRQNLRAGADP